MPRVAVLLLVLGLSPIAPAARAQTTDSATRLTRQTASATTVVSPALVTVPDSVRQGVGYQHWKGAAIGGGLGALGGLLLTLAAHGECADCTSNTAPVGKVTSIGAGIGGALGFLVGLASPRYRWVQTTER